jgi:hypothetical protein
MRKKVNYPELIGNRFGRLLVTGITKGGKDTIVNCTCDCGNIAAVTYSNLNRGNTKSCGCWKVEHGGITGRNTTTHGMSFTKAYRTWSSIKRRCYSKNHKDYKWYGARGISVCEKWIESFESFYADMGAPPHGMSIDRIDNSLGYSVENCRWASSVEQNSNRRNTSEWSNAEENKKKRLLRTRNCITCNAEFLARASQIKDGVGICCSRKCNGINKAKLNRAVKP